MYFLETSLPIHSSIICSTALVHNHPYYVYKWAVVNYTKIGQKWNNNTGGRNSFQSVYNDNTHSYTRCLTRIHSSIILLPVICYTTFIILLLNRNVMTSLPRFPCHHHYKPHQVSMSTTLHRTLVDTLFTAACRPLLLNAQQL